jgi:hypothetical protein
MVLIYPRCSIGGGCGISCGKPDGVNCISANKSVYGACIDDTDLVPFSKINTEVFNSKTGFNFVGGDIDSCNSSIRSRYREATGKSLANNNFCSLGGGCGVSCGKPNGTTCVSANPSNMGACFGYDEFQSLPSL